MSAWKPLIVWAAVSALVSLATGAVLVALLISRLEYLL